MSLQYMGATFTIDTATDSVAIDDGRNVVCLSPFHAWALWKWLSCHRLDIGDMMGGQTPTAEALLAHELRAAADIDAMRGVLLPDEGAVLPRIQVQEQEKAF